MNGWYGKISDNDNIEELLKIVILLKRKNCYYFISKNCYFFCLKVKIVILLIS